MKWYAEDYSSLGTNEQTDLVINVVELSDTSAAIWNVPLIEITLTQAQNRTNAGLPKYKIVSGVVTERTETEIVASLQTDRKIQCKANFIADIRWTDEDREFYNKFKDRNPSDTTYDTWFEDIMVFWSEAWTEYSNNKTAINDATLITDFNTISYSPVHTKSKTTLDGEKPA